MTKVTFITVLLCLAGSGLFAQLQQIKPVMAVVFTKEIEKNYKNGNSALSSNDKTEKEYNRDSIKDFEKLFFGDFNAPVTYFMFPPFDGAYGLRIVKNAANTSDKLEIKYISNFEEVEALLEKKFPPIGASPTQWSSMSDEEKDRLNDSNDVIWKKRQEEKRKRHKIETLSVPVSNAFAEKLHAKFVAVMDTLPMEKKVPGVIFDADNVTFRCIVGDELWTLDYRNPDGEAGKLSALCGQIVEDVKAGNFKEQDYIELPEN